MADNNGRVNWTLYWQTFRNVFLGMLEKPLWLLLIISLCIMSLVYVRPSLWDLPVAVIDQDHSHMSRALIRRIDSTAKVEVKGYNNLDNARQDMLLRKIFAIIIVPVDFEKHLLSGINVTVPVYGDATNRLANGQIQQDLALAYQQLLSEFNGALLLKAGFSTEQVKLLLQPIRGETIGLFNPGISYAAIVFPGLLVMLLQHSLLIASIRVSVAIRGTPKGKPPLPVYLGALSALIPIWLFLSVIFFVLWPWVLGYRQDAPIYLLLLLTFPFLLAVLGLGKLVTECLRSVEMIYLTLAFITTPIFYISGTIWPIQAMPDWVRMISSALPSTWATKAIAGINQMGLPLHSVFKDIGMMLLLGVIYMILGILVGMLRNGELRGVTQRIKRFFIHD
ncbi:ABC transporter permease [Xenorhabdus sp. 42]|uniref:ABC transporter permease n=2 Tax=Xenorhabdus szentirmaii TaxID=290112 RepID=A0AAW3YUI0_9GAMM|nr:MULTISPECIES: ABC transporter permease [unclassified Xenorhabdus]MBD2803332.1 ABC transporter permease [Xenorhabdus sp. ZM]MBD2821408.1 ABC transporter permease [Xenorhabdus sp. 42]MBD2825081.1 ABC transporter permease [Xenorhabdus sp. 5]MBD2791319.1 ABC transporter permease [Xenorhabdus sp. CUL]MBD2799968.1 ABC transporter permease [Xenorhabdus sp. M]